jgi:hypothetical protein
MTFYQIFPSLGSEIVVLIYWLSEDFAVEVLEIERVDGCQAELLSHKFFAMVIYLFVLEST